MSPPDHSKQASVSGCEPCAHARPADEEQRCRRELNCNGTSQCGWLAAAERTLALLWDDAGVRGWGNYWPYLRTSHYSAATLGRRLLLVHDDAGALPTDVLQLGGSLPWRLPRAELERSYRAVGRADLKHWMARHAVNQSIGRALLPYLRTLDHVPHVFLNVSGLPLSFSKLSLATAIS